MNNYIRTMMSEIDAPSQILKDEHPGFFIIPDDRIFVCNPG